MADPESGKVKVFINCCTRLSNLVETIETSVINKDELLKTLEEIVGTMEKLANDTNFLCDDDDVTEIEDMPAEIKDWLASTFTSTNVKNRRTQRPRFKAVANAILAMLMVEKIFKKSTETAAMNIPPALSKIMENSINEWDFDVLSFDSKCNGDTLKYMTVYLFLHHNVLRKYKISYDLLDEFMNNLQIGYSKNNNPYYNAIHAADVLQTVHYFIQNFKLSNWLTDLQIFVFLFSAVIHDHDDPGVSNSFLIKTNNYLSLIYNDSQIKENHHISSVFKIFQNPKCMFLRGLNKNEYSEFRKNVIECVLNADLSQHFHHLKTIKGELASGNEIDKMKVVEFLLHTADISNPAKVWSLHNKWVEMWQEQMMKQGDLEFELNIPYSPLCSRKLIYTAEIQTNMLTYITEPTFQLVEQLLETIRPPMQLTKSLSELTIQPTLSKHNSGSSSMGKAYPWGNRIVLNKSMWSRMTLARTRSNQTPTLDSN